MPWSFYLTCLNNELFAVKEGKKPQPDRVNRIMNTMAKNARYFIPPNFWTGRKRD